MYVGAEPAGRLGAGWRLARRRPPSILDVAGEIQDSAAVEAADAHGAPPSSVKFARWQAGGSSPAGILPAVLAAGGDLPLGLGGGGGASRASRRVPGLRPDDRGRKVSLLAAGSYWRPGGASCRARTAAGLLERTRAPPQQERLAPGDVVGGRCHSRRRSGPCSAPAYDISVNEAFFLDCTEVTQAAYERCVRAGKCAAPACQYDPAADGDHPVVCVTWTQARDFCGWRDARLPTEAQWKVAALSLRPHISWSRTLPPATGPTSPATAAPPCASAASTAAVARTSLDSAGNVEEWTADAARCKNAEPRRTEPAGRCRAVRGGAYDQKAKTLVSWRRRPTPEDAPAATRGFRCARGESPAQTLVPPEPAPEAVAEENEVSDDAPAAPRRNRNRAILFTGTSVATLALSGFFTYGARADWKDSRDECPETGDCALRDSAKSQVTSPNASSKKLAPCDKALTKKTLTSALMSAQ